jgi:pimeloyl-ACP methyl ester carboxylesterase
VNCEIAGEGLPLVLLHGIGSNSKSWRRQLAALSPRLRVIAWDAPGFGRSSDPVAGVPALREYAECLNGLFESLGLVSAIVLGHSLGGLIAQEFYRVFPERIRALILSDTSQGDGAEAADVRQRKLSMRLDAIRTKTAQQLAQSRAPFLLSRGASSELVQETISIMSEIRPAGYEYAARSIAGADMRGILDNVTVPLLMIWGKEDEVTPVWKDLPERASVEIVPNAAHLCYAEQPEAFNSIVLGFVEWITSELR